MEVANILVSATTGQCTLRKRIPAGLVGGTVTVEFTDPVWEGLNKTVVFRGTGSKAALFDGSVAEIPHEVIAVPGVRLWFGIFGADPDTGLQLPLIEVAVGMVENSTDPNADPSTDPSLPIWAQLQERVEDLTNGSPDGPVEDGEDGGYYTPAVTQPAEDTIQFGWTPSKPDMPAVDPVQVTIPGSGGNAEDGEDGFSPIATVTQTDSGAVISITDRDGTTTATITNGKDGKDGADGAKGDTGDVGPQGPQGEKGDTGATGPQGIQGETGPQGEQGIQGIPGEKGDKGDKGDTGDVGPQGPAYTLTSDDKAEMVEAVLTATEGIPSYWKTALDNGVEAINSALCEAGRNKSAFLFYSDSHWNYGSQMAPALLKYLHKHTGMTKTFFGGDIVNDEASDYDTMEYLWEWRRQLKDLPNHHSVPGNHDDGNATNNLFSEQYVYGYLLAAEETPDIVRGDSGLYYYIDNPAERTRYLCLDTGYQDFSALSEDQAEFIKESLKSTPADWHIVVVAHVWYMVDYDQYDQRPVPVAGLSATASSIITILDNYNSRTGEYADCGGWVEFCIGGHIHYDYDATTSTGIPIILVETDSMHTRGNYTATAGTTTEASVNGLIADYTNHKIYVVRIGRGVSRVIEVENYVVSYTNLLAADQIGYEVDQEYSTSSYTQRASSGGFDLTGWIALTDGETYYLKNLVMPNGHDTWRNCAVYWFNDDKTWGGSFTMSTSDDTALTFNPVYGDDGNLAQFTVPSGWTGKWMRINCTQIDDTSILTRNEPIE